MSEVPSDRAPEQSDRGRFEYETWCRSNASVRGIKTDRATLLMYSYLDGIYVPDGEVVIQENLVKERGNDYRPSDLATAIQITQGLTFSDLAEPPCHEICLRNGVLNLNSMSLSMHSQAYFFTSKVDVDYRPEAKCPVFLAELGNILPDQKKRDCLQETFGYCLLRRYPYHKLFFFVGSGRNGKGTVVRTLLNIIGRDNVSATPLEMLSMRFQVTNLYSKLVNVSSEPKAKYFLDTEILKSATGEDPIDGEIKGKQKKLHFTNYAKFIIQANKLPRVSDGSTAWWERVIIIEFTEEFTSENGKLVPDIEQRWLSSEEERSGILNWMIEGLKRLLANNDFTKSEEMLNAESEYRRYSDPIACFLEDCCKVKVGLIAPKADLYEAYKEYSEQNDFEILSVNAFNEMIRKIPRTRSENRRIEGKVCKAWVGIALKGANAENEQRSLENVTEVTDVTDLYTRQSISDSNNRVGIDTGNNGNNGNISDSAPVQASVPGINNAEINNAENGNIGFLIKAVARQPSGLGRAWVIGLIKDCYPKEDPEAILQKFCDQGIFLEAGGRVMKA